MIHPVGSVHMVSKGYWLARSLTSKSQGKRFLFLKMSCHANSSGHFVTNDNYVVIFSIPSVNERHTDKEIWCKSGPFY